MSQALQLRVLIFGFVLVFIASAAFAQNTERKVSIDQVPAKVRKAIKAAVGNGTLIDIGEISSDGKTSYEIEMHLGGKEYDVLFAANGKVVSKSLEGRAPGAKPAKLNRNKSKKQPAKQEAPKRADTDNNRDKNTSQNDDDADDDEGDEADEGDEDDEDEGDDDEDEEDDADEDEGDMNEDDADEGDDEDEEGDEDEGEEDGDEDEGDDGEGDEGDDDEGDDEGDEGDDDEGDEDRDEDEGDDDEDEGDMNEDDADEEEGDEADEDEQGDDDQTDEGNPRTNGVLGQNNSFRTTVELNASDNLAGRFQTEFDLQARKLTTIGRNKFFVLEPGYQLVLEGKDGPRDARLEINVLNETKTVGGVETRVVEERETIDGELVEVSRNFFAICENSNSVFYFGEEVDIYRDGEVIAHKGAWAHGQNRARAGMMMPGECLLGASFYQEHAPGSAMDRARIVDLNASLETPAGKFEKCLKVWEENPLDGDSETKTYAPDIGLIQDEGLRLVKHGFVR